jgi:hypothetical protein
VGSEGGLRFSVAVDHGTQCGVILCVTVTDITLIIQIGVMVLVATIIIISIIIT